MFGITKDGDAWLTRGAAGENLFSTSFDGKIQISGLATGSVLESVQPAPMRRTGLFSDLPDVTPGL